jgi:hypothetical protein
MLSAQPAVAETATISYPPQAATLSGGAILTTAVHLPDSILPGFSISFVLPRDYAANRAVRIVLYLTTGASKPCSINLVPLGLTRRRIGESPVSGFGGLAPADGSPTVTFPDNAVVGKVFELKPAIGFPGQRRGDLIVLGFQRGGSHPSDTCADDAFVQGIDIRYPLK